MNDLKTEDAQMSGQAQRIPAALKAQSAIAHATIQITRAETGKVEEYELTFTPLPENDQSPTL